MGKLEHDGGLYRFLYVRGARKPGFQPFHGMEDLDQVYEPDELFPLFANRLLSQARAEYEYYLRWSGFEKENPPAPLVVLGVAEGIWVTDAVEVFPCPVPGTEGYYVNKFFLHGIRWMPQAAMERISRLVQGEPLKIMVDLQNEYDLRAVAVRTETKRTQIGYVLRYLAHDVWQLVGRCAVEFIDLRVDRLKSDAPLQNGVLCRMRACWPEAFQPSSGADFLPIPSGVAERCSPADSD